jgi:hypothetical protein
MDGEGSAMSVWRLIVLVALAQVTAFAHVGNPNIFFEGDAGPYPIRVTIRPPRVVPGLAQIAVRVKTNFTGQVSALPARWDTGRKGSPPPDIAKPVAGETNYFATDLWLMNPGAYSVFVNVEGASGKGTAIVPINSMATSRLPMKPWMSSLFLGFGAVLFVTLAALLGTAIREGSLGLDEAISRRRIWAGRIATTLGACLFASLLFIGKRWWDQVDRNFEMRRLYKPLQVATGVTNNVLSLEIQEKRFNRYDETPLVPEHGKLMHLFLVSEKDGKAFAHLHPTRASTNRFAMPVPALPRGTYHVYADITHESGFTQTLLSKIELPGDGAKASDPDDAIHVADADGKAAVVKFANDHTLEWQRETASLKANEETTLRFQVKTPARTLATLEPYLGMYAHTIVWKNDGKVFTHLHPLGTISMTSQLLFAKREAGERNLANKPLDIYCGPPPEAITVPYAFPEAGSYRMWVQVRVGGELQTAAFDVEVL